MNLLDKHLEDLRSSGLNDHMIELAAFRSGSRTEVTALLAFDPGSGGLIIPYPNTNGTGPEAVRVKPDVAFLDSKGKLAKYLSPKNSANRLYIPPIYTDADLANTALPIIVVEGEKKALKGAQELRGFVVIGLSGVWNFKSKNIPLIPDFDRIVFTNRQLFIAFDSDLPEKKSVQNAEKALATALIERGAFVRLVRIPQAADGSKQGLDDFLLARAVDAFMDLLKTAKTGHAKTQRSSQTESTGDPQAKNSGGSGLDGHKVANLNNAVTIIEGDPKFCGVSFDQFLQRILVGDPPREWTETDDVHLMLLFQREKGLAKMAIETVRAAVLEIAFRYKRNCVKDWLQSLLWDRVPRIGTFFEDFYGVNPTPYAQAAGKNFLIAMVARIYRPGCQVDNMIVLEGPQGILKSSSLRALAGDHHAEQHETVTSKDFLQNLQGKWLIEISEMDSFSRSEISKVKAVITTVRDYFRPSFGRRSADHPRQCVFVGTTNRDDWNRDETGARRFWPIACRDIDLDGIRKHRDQLFAEAVHCFKSKDSWWKMPVEDTLKQQADRYVAPAWTEPILRYIENELFRDENNRVFRSIPRETPLKELSIADVFEHALEIPEAQWTKANEMRIAECLHYLGWERRDAWRNKKTVKRWFPLLPEGGNGDEGSNA